MSSDNDNDDLNLSRRSMLRTVGVASAVAAVAAVAATTAPSVMAKANTANSDSSMKNEPASTPKPYPRTFSHIGISVPDLNKAVKFYTEVLGCYTIMEPTDVKEDDSPIGLMCTDVFGPGWDRFRIAHLSTGDRIGVELFQFKNQENPKDNSSIGKLAFFTFVFKILTLKS